MYSHVVARPNIRNNEFMLLMHLQLERRVIFVIFSVAQCKGALLLVIDTNSSIHYSLHIHLSGLFKWHWSYIITIPVHFWICQRGHQVISFCNTYWFQCTSPECWSTASPFAWRKRMKPVTFQCAPKVKWHLSTVPNVSAVPTRTPLSGVITVISAACPTRGSNGSAPLLH